LIIGAAAAIDLMLRPSRNKQHDAAFGAPQSLNEPLQVQLARAKERVGRQATSPTDIPWKGWKDIFWRVIQQTSEDRLLSIAAGGVSYGLLALFPAITALVSCYGLFANPDGINNHLPSCRASFLPKPIPSCRIR
jgi:membrane protein